MFNLERLNKRTSTNGADHNRRSRSGPCCDLRVGHCDGVRDHAFCTRAYAEEVVVPEIEKGLSQSGRKRENFQVAGGGFIVTGGRHDDAHPVTSPNCRAANVVSTPSPMTSYRERASIRRLVRPPSRNCG
jgi:hypothetical protein